MKIKELFENNLYHFIGTCVNSFDEDGECNFSNYRDVTDFAQAEESAESITKEKFYSMANVNGLNIIKIFGKNPQFLYDKENDVLMAYNSKTDIHYFFVK